MEKELSMAVEKDPGNWIYAKELARFFKSREKFEKAIEYYKQSIIHYGKDKETYYNMALAYQQLEDNKKAQQMIENALVLHPNYREAKKLLKEVKESSKARKNV